MRRTVQNVMLAIIAGLSLSACSTWDGLTHQEKSTAVGAGIGGVAGAAVSGGGVLGTVGGAAVGGVIGHEVGD